jgi:hypothetical protein
MILREDYAKLAVVAAFIIGIANQMLMPCVCGHLGWLALPGSLISTGLAWIAFTRTRQMDWPWRAVVYAAVGLLTIGLLKNVADIGWFGHSPLFA